MPSRTIHCGCGIAFALLVAANGTGAERVTVDPGLDDVEEEIIVRGRPDDRHQVVNLETMMGIYQSRLQGSILYRQQEYAEALPHLLAAARRGFKFAQARVGFILQQGVDGVPQDPQAAVAWLGVAATGDTHPEIRNYFKALWAKIPDQQRPALEDRIRLYNDRYGSRANRVTCDMSHKAGTWLKKLTCRFQDEHLYRIGAEFDPHGWATSTIEPSP
ncbi:MAG: hypothetical protein OXK76_08100 [Gammaproteobacteria bacterium]|nr:hypothetical protein [Gammaproteobacteria bacterium]